MQLIINLPLQPGADPEDLARGRGGRRGTKLEDQGTEVRGVVFGGGEQPAPSPPAMRSGERCKLPSGVRANCDKPSWGGDLPPPLDGSTTDCIVYEM